MNNWSGRLAAAFRWFHQRARKTVVAASLLILALSVSGCSVLLERDKGIRLFTVVTTLWKLLPINMPTTPYEFFVEVAGEDYGDKYAEGLLKLADFPDLSEGVFGDILDILVYVGAVLVAVYLLKYFSTLWKYLGEYSMKEINRGETALVPPWQYILKRFLPVVLLLIPMVAIVSVFTELLSEIVQGMALALYESAETDMASVIHELFVTMLEGLKVWTFLLTFLVSFLGGLVLVAWMAWRFISIPIFTGLIYFHAPRHMIGDQPGQLSKPLERVFHRGLVLGVSVFFVIIGPLIALQIGLSGFPVAIGLWISMILTAWMPWLLFRFGWFIPGAKGVANRLASPFDNLARTPGARIRAEIEREPLRHRLWSKVPKPVKTVGRIGVEVAKREPHAGPIIAAGGAIIDEVRRGDPEEIGRDVSRRVFRDQRFSVSQRSVVGSSSGGSANPRRGSLPALDALMRGATTSGITDRKDELSDELYAYASFLARKGYAGSTIDQVITDAKQQLGSFSERQVNSWREIGGQLRNHT